MFFRQAHVSKWGSPWNSFKLNADDFKSSEIPQISWNYREMKLFGAAQILVCRNIRSTCGHVSKHLREVLSVPCKRFVMIENIPGASCESAWIVELVINGVFWVRKWILSQKGTSKRLFHSELWPTKKIGIEKKPNELKMLCFWAHVSVTRRKGEDLALENTI